MRAAETDVVIVGGGIAGLSAAYHLSARGARVALFEREPLLAFHASGRNAAIFRHLERDPVGAHLALRSRELLRTLESDGPLMKETGALYVGAHDALAPLETTADAAGLPFQVIHGEDLPRVSSVLRGTDAERGILVPADGVIDIHALISILSVRAREGGARIETGVGVRRIVRESSQSCGVELDDGRFIPSEKVLIAGGAWASPLGGSCDAPLPIEPRRRHLMLLIPHAPTVIGPVVWRVDEQVYFRDESGGVLASPCDETASQPGIPETSPEAAIQLAARLARLAPSLSESDVRTTWACLRSFAPDGGFVVGEDPRVKRLYWLAGLGGRGMTCGLALGELVAAQLNGAEARFAPELSPERLLNAVT